MKSLTRPELDSLLSTSRRHSPSTFWMLLLAWNHGLRVSEVLSLTPQHFVSGKLVIQRLKGSRKTSQPVLLLETSGLRDEFLAFVATRTGLLFLPEYLNRDSARVIVWRRMKAYGKEAGVDVEKVFPHALKHTCGRLAYRGGVGIPEVQIWLGHVNGANTLRYMEPTEEEASQAMAAAAGKA